MKRFYFRVTALLVISTAAVPVFSASMRIYGLKNAQHYYNTVQGTYYIQLQYFSNKQNAYRYQAKIQAKTSRKVRIEQHHNHFAIVLGPLQSSAEVRAVSKEIIGDDVQIYPSKLISSSKLVKKKSPDPVRVSQVKPAILCSGCYLGAGIGRQWNDFDQNISVYNGSGYPQPYDKDKFSTSQGGQTLVVLSGGYRWKREAQWLLPHYSLGLKYKHIFAKNIGQNITQYSMPEFTDYKYDWKLHSNAILANIKLDLFNYSQFSPYLTGGLGIAFNSAQGYTETALPGVTSRISPAFSNHVNNELSFELGVGLDYQLSKTVLISLAYEYQNLGKISSGNGLYSWVGQNLHLNSYSSNGVLLSVSYLVGGDEK